MAVGYNSRTKEKMGTCKENTAAPLSTKNLSKESDLDFYNPA